MELTLKILILAGIPSAFLFGIFKTASYWPLAFNTFVGTTICAINFRIAGALADLDKSASPILADHPTGDLYRLLAWLVCPFLLIIGLRKLYRIRITRAIEDLHQEE